MHYPQISTYMSFKIDWRKRKNKSNLKHNSLISACWFFFSKTSGLGWIFHFLFCLTIYLTAVQHEVQSKYSLCSVVRDFPLHPSFTTIATSLWCMHQPILQQCIKRVFWCIWAILGTNHYLTNRFYAKKLYLNQFYSLKWASVMQDMEFIALLEKTLVDREM